MARRECSRSHGAGNGVLRGIVGRWARPLLYTFGLAAGVVALWALGSVLGSASASAAPLAGTAAAGVVSPVTPAGTQQKTGSAPGKPGQGKSNKGKKTQGKQGKRPGVVSVSLKPPTVPVNIDTRGKTCAPNPPGPGGASLMICRLVPAPKPVPPVKRVKPTKPVKPAPPVKPPKKKAPSCDNPPANVRMQCPPRIPRPCVQGTTVSTPGRAICLPRPVPVPPPGDIQCFRAPCFPQVKFPRPWRKIPPPRLTEPVPGSGCYMRPLPPGLFQPMVCRHADGTMGREVTAAI